MKILHFHPDGRMAKRFVDPLVEAERLEGHDSTMITSIRKSGVSSMEIPYDISMRNLLCLPWSFWRICKFLKLRKPDIVISHNAKSSPVPLLAAWLMGVGVRVYFNHGVPYAGYTGLLRSLLRMIEFLNCSLATHLVTVSSDMVKLLREFNQKIEPIIILNGSACGLDLENYSAERYKESLWRSKNRIGDDDVVVVFVGRPEKRKGFQHALRLWTHHLTDPKYKLVLCGAQNSDVLKHLPVIPPNVLCLGFVTNIPEILSNADVVILPSLHEGLSYAILEAMACGSIVIANNICGIRCLIRDQVNGYLVEGNDPEKYAELIRAVGTDKQAVLAIRQQARTSVSRFSRALFLPAYVSFLRGLLERQTRRPS